MGRSNCTNLNYVRDRMGGAPRSVETGAVGAAEGCLSSGSSETFETAFSLPRLRQQLSPLIPRMWTWMVRRSCSASVNRSEMTLVKTLAQTIPPIPTLRRRGDEATILLHSTLQHLAGENKSPLMMLTPTPGRA